MPVFFSFQQVREDLAEHTHAIAEDALWREYAGNHSLGFHLKHIAGSVDRLTTYLLGNELSEAQLAFLHNEHQAEGRLSDLLSLVDESLQRAEQQLLNVKPESLYDHRTVGRKYAPTSVLGLLVHVCEHTQRHLGQAVLICRMLKY